MSEETWTEEHFNMLCATSQMQNNMVFIISRIYTKSQELELDIFWNSGELRGGRGWETM